MLQPLMGQYITCIKMSTLASIIGVNEVMHKANSVIQQTFRPIEVFTTVAFMFLILIIPLRRSPFFNKKEVKLSVSLDC